MTVARCGARLGVAAFAVGAALAGPQALGSALADDSGPGAPSVSAGDARGEGVQAGGSAAAGPVRRPAAAVARPVDREITPPVSAAVSAPATRQRAHGAVEGRPSRSTPVGPSSELTAGALLLARRTQPAEAQSAGQRVASVSGDVSLGAATGDPTVTATAPPSQTTVAVSDWFSSTRGWLSGLDNPLTTGLRDLLTGVQRTLFSPAPTVKPVQFTAWTPGEPILGALRYIQPGGAPVTFKVTQGPSSGTVELSTDGTYTYTAGPDFTGTDSFTVAVTAGGFNLLEPLTPRTAPVTVIVESAPRVQLTRGFDITNLSGKAVYVSGIVKEPGYEDSVEQAPATGTVLQPGASTHVELTRWAFYSYDTRINFTGCSDIACTSLKSGDQGPWQVKMYVQLLDTYRGDCNWNNCLNGSGQEIGPSSPNGFYGLDNSVIKLVDEPDTKYTLTGAEGQQQANVINTVCAAQGTTCQFVPTSDTLYTTKPQQVYQFTNRTQDNQTVKQGATETISATSSFGTTYSSEVGASFGQKDVFNFVAKQTFTSTQSLSNTTQRTTTWEVNTTVRPGYRLTTTVTVPIARVTGDYSAKIGNTTYNLTGVSFDFIDPNAKDKPQLDYTSTTTQVGGPGVVT